MACKAGVYKAGLHLHRCMLQQQAEHMIHVQGMSLTPRDLFGGLCVEITLQLLLGSAGCFGLCLCASLQLSNSTAAVVEFQL